MLPYRRVECHGAWQKGSPLPLLLFQFLHSLRRSVNPTVNSTFDGCIWDTEHSIGVIRISVDDMVSTLVKANRHLFMGRCINIYKPYTVLPSKT